MSVPLSATGRITLPYTVSGFVHKFRLYCRNPQVAGGSYNINSRATDANDTPWTDAMNDMATTLSYVLWGGVTIGDGLLEHQAGGIWTPLATATPTYTDHATGAVIPGWQTTLVLRDLLLHKVKAVVIEGNVSELSHYSSYSSVLPTRAQNFVKEFLSTHVLTNAPYIWMVGRGNQYLNTSPLVGITETPNRRVRRRRGLT